MKLSVRHIQHKVAKDCSSVDEFITKYYKNRRLLDKYMGVGYEGCVRKNARNNVKYFGSAYIPYRDSNTGFEVYFFERRRVS